MPLRSVRLCPVSCSVLVAVLLSILFTPGVLRSQTPNKPFGTVALSNLPVNFEPNQGQAEQRTRFVARAGEVNVALRPNAIDLLFPNDNRGSSQLTLNLVGANANAFLAASDLKSSYSNYILGADPSRWLSHVPNFGRVSYSEIYPGINLIFHGNGQRLEHDFVIEPDADYRSIRLRVDGPKHLELRADGSLHLVFPEGDLVLEKPEAFQDSGDGQISVSSHFVLFNKNEFGFAVADYDHTKSLTIDPVLTYSTYLANFQLYMGGVATDAAGDTFATGLVFDAAYPVTPNAFQKTCDSCSNDLPDVFITKLNPTGTALIYSTFLGGSNYDQPFSIAVDSNGNAVIAGLTMSADFPVKNAVSAGPATNGTQYGFITSLSADGSVLNYSSILGGAKGETPGGTTLAAAVAVDANGNAYIAGTTDSPAFPVTPGALNLVAPAYPNNVLFACKFSPTGSLGYSALFGDASPQNGGAGLIGVTGIAVDTNGSAYITGASGTLLPTTSGAYQTTIPGTAPYAAPFVTKLSADGSAFVYSTFIGISGQSSGIVVKQSSGEAFLTGIAPNNFPTTSNAYLKSTTSASPAFFTELSADGSSLLYSSFFTPDVTGGLSSITSTTGIALDSANNIWLVGGTTSSQFLLQNPLQSLGANQNVFPTTTGFISRFDSTGTNLAFSSYFGGTVQGGSIVGVAIDPNDRAHITGTTGDALFTTPGAFLSSATPPPPNYYPAFGYAAVIDANVPAPSLCLNTADVPYSSVGFGNVRPGQSATQTITITNCGNAPLQVGTVQSSSPLFTVPGSLNTCAQSVAANGSCSIGVTFSPTATGSFTGTLSITSNAPVSVVQLSLQGTGAVPQITLQTSSITFDPQFIGQTSPQQFVLVSNSGGVPLNINLAQTTITAGFAYTQTGCGQPISPLSGVGCVFTMTFTPQSAGTLTGTLNIASDDPNTPVATVNLSGTGYSSYPVASLTALSLPTIQAGSTSVSLQVYGTNFFPASIIRVAGTAQPTTYQNSASLTATVDPSLVATLGEIPVTVFTPSPGGGETSPLTITVYLSLPLAARDMVYDPFSQHLFASIEASASNNPNTIAVIDPVGGKVIQYIPVGNNPRHLAVSNDGLYLYVALDGDHSLQRINLGTLAVERTFALPVQSPSDQPTVADMQVVPGSSQSIVVALFRDSSPAEDGIALFNDSGLVNWLENESTDNYVMVDSFAIAGNPPVAYSIPNAFTTFSLDSAGIHFQSVGNLSGQSIGYTVRSDGSLLYTTGGLVWNPSSQTVVGTYPMSDLFQNVSVVPDDSLGRTFFLNTVASYNGYQATSVDAYDQSSFAFIASVPFLPTVVSESNAVALNRWGSDGLAFVVGDFVQATGSDQVILFRSSIAQVGSVSNPVPVLSALGSSTVTVGGAPFVLKVQGSSFVPSSVVQWNGSGRTTTFVSATQLTANIPASDIAQLGAELITVLNPTPGGGTSFALTLTVVPAPALASFQPASVTFDSRTVGTQSAFQTVQLQNTGGSPLAISGIQTSGDFAETNNCSASLPAGSSCVLSITFAPTAAGTRQGNLTVTDSAANSPQTVALSGTGTAPNFAFGTGGSNTSSVTVSAGQTGNYSLSIVSAPGSTGIVTLTCTQVPVNAACSVTPSSLTLSSGGTATFRVTVTTAVSQAASFISRLSTRAAGCGFFFWFLGLRFALRRRKALQFPRSCTLLLGIISLVIVASLAACAGGSGSSTSTSSTATPKGTYTLEVVATQGATTHSLPITLVVQ
jgi:Abnormal spindle-like microcephaly-assoc'd, ASPM-SPD-2-Hydin/Beta-propeller repeat